MKRMLLLLVGVVTLSFSRSYADPVIDWNATAVTVMSRVPTLARSFFVDLAYVHVAIYDAVNAVDRKHQVFAVDPANAASWASKEAAIAAAAHRVLVTFYPPQKAFLDSVYDAAIANLPSDSTTARGIAIGDTVASQYLALRVGDRREGVATYTWRSVGVGVYQPTPPGAAQYQPAGMWTAQMRPFVMDSASQLRAPVPPAITSDVYTKDFIEVKASGSRDTSSTSPKQREVARFHTENPNLFLTRNIRDIATSKAMSIDDNARYFAQLYLTIADAQITGFNSKYYYNCWRPVTAIREADTDGNPLTVQDTSWMPLLTTPLHPEYPAAHGVAMGALTFGLQEFFGTPYLNIELRSNITGTTHVFSTSNDLVAEVVNARVWGGMHFRTSVEQGMAIAQRIAAAVAGRFTQVAQTFWLAQHVSGLPTSVNPDVQLAAVNDQICWGVKGTRAQYIRTTDGGVSWNTSSIQGASGLQGASITALDANTAWVAMYDPFLNTSGGVFKTTDGGTNWTKQTTAFPGSGGYPVDIHFFNSNDGVVIGNPHGGNWEIYTTSDGGAQWTQVPSANIPPSRPGEFSLEGLGATSGDRIWFGAVAGGNNGVYRSFDRGMTWSVTRNLPGRDAACVAFKDSVNGLVCGPFVGPGNVIDRTTDGGITWTAVQNVPSTPSAYFISYVPGTRGSYVMTSTSNIDYPKATVPGSAYSKDDGTSWTLADNLPHNASAFASPSTGWSAGKGDVIYRWTDPLVLGIEPAVHQVSEIAQAYRLEQNYPNPFNPSTVIRFSLPVGTSGTVALRVYNVLGQEVKTLVNDKLQPGSYESTFDATGLASGAYFYRLTAGSFVQTKRLLLIR